MRLTILFALGVSELVLTLYAPIPTKWSNTLKKSVGKFCGVGT